MPQTCKIKPKHCDHRDGKLEGLTYVKVDETKIVTFLFWFVFFPWISMLDIKKGGVSWATSKTAWKQPVDKVGEYQ